MTRDCGCSFCGRLTLLVQEGTEHAGVTLGQFLTAAKGAAYEHQIPKAAFGS
jgi:hypothetical protein